jgi:hypothetical protein
LVIVFSPNVSVFGKGFFGLGVIFMSRVVGQHVFDEAVGILPVIHSQLAGFFEGVKVCFSVQGQQSVTGFVELFGIAVLLKEFGNILAQDGGLFAGQIPVIVRTAVTVVFMMGA